MAAMFSLFRSRRNEAWEGVVVAKKRVIADGSGAYFYLTVRLPDDTTKRVRVHRSLWKSAEVGDAVVKAAGERSTKK